MSGQTKPQFAFDPENVNGGERAKAPRGTVSGLNSGEEAPEFKERRNAPRYVPTNGVRLMPGSRAIPPGSQELNNEQLRQSREPGAATVIAKEEAPTTAPASAPTSVKRAEEAVDDKLKLQSK